jgi:hypothetical protein
MFFEKEVKKMCHLESKIISDNLLDVFPKDRGFAIAVIPEFDSLGSADTPEITLTNVTNDEELVSRVYNVGKEIKEEGYRFDHRRYPAEVFMVEENKKIVTAVIVAVAGNSFSPADANSTFVAGGLFENKLIERIGNIVKDQGAELKTVFGRIFF